MLRETRPLQPIKRVTSQSTLLPPPGEDHVYLYGSGSQGGDLLGRVRLTSTRMHEITRDGRCKRDGGARTRRSCAMNMDISFESTARFRQDGIGKPPQKGLNTCMHRCWLISGARPLRGRRSSTVPYQAPVFTRRPLLFSNKAKKKSRRRRRLDMRLDLNKVMT